MVEEIVRFELNRLTPYPVTPTWRTGSTQIEDVDLWLVQPTRNEPDVLELRVTADVNPILIDNFRLLTVNGNVDEQVAWVYQQHGPNRLARGMVKIAAATASIAAAVIPAWLRSAAEAEIDPAREEQLLLLTTGVLDKAGELATVLDAGFAQGSAAMVTARDALVVAFQQFTDFAGPDGDNPVLALPRAAGVTAGAAQDTLVGAITTVFQVVYNTSVPFIGAIAAGPMATLNAAIPAAIAAGTALPFNATDAVLAYNATQLAAANATVADLGGALVPYVNTPGLFESIATAASEFITELIPVIISYIPEFPTAAVDALGAIPGDAIAAAATGLGKAIVAIAALGDANIRNIKVIADALSTAASYVAMPFRFAQSLVNALTTITGAVQALAPLLPWMAGLAATGLATHEALRLWDRVRTRPPLRRDFRMHWRVLFFVQGAVQNAWDCAGERLATELRAILNEFYNLGRAPYIGAFEARTSRHRVLVVDTDSGTGTAFPLMVLLSTTALQVVLPCVIELPETKSAAPDTGLLTQARADATPSAQLLDDIGLVPRGTAAVEVPPHWLATHAETEEGRDAFVDAYYASAGTVGYLVQDDVTNQWRCGSRMRGIVRNFLASHWAKRPGVDIRADNYVSDHALAVTVDGLDITLIPNYSEYATDAFFFAQDAATKRVRLVVYCPLRLPMHEGAASPKKTPAAIRALSTELSNPLQIPHLRGADILTRYTTLVRNA